jgi:hypothetical protein
MAKALKIQKLTLDADDYFSDLPFSAFENCADHQLFENFVESELEVELIRAMKFQVLVEYGKEKIKDVIRSELSPDRPGDKLKKKKLDKLKQEVFLDYIENKILNINEEGLLNEESIYN